MAALPEIQGRTEHEPSEIGRILRLGRARVINSSQAKVEEALAALKEALELEPNASLKTRILAATKLIMDGPDEGL